MEEEGLAGEGDAALVPFIRGLEHATPSSDDLKALSAAFGTSSSGALFHLAGHTPEAAAVDAATAPPATAPPATASPATASPTTASLAAPPLAGPPLAPGGLEGSAAHSASSNCGGGGGGSDSEDGGSARCIRAHTGLPDHLPDWPTPDRPAREGELVLSLAALERAYTALDGGHAQPIDGAHDRAHSAHDGAHDRAHGGAHDASDGAHDRAHDGAHSAHDGTFDRAHDGAHGELPIELVALGNPHFSLSECARLAELSTAALQAGRRRREDVSMVITLGREVLRDARAAGYTRPIESFGATFITDTCWCMLQEPIVPPHARTLITNSAKYAHYAPALVRRRVRFSGLAGCIAAAATGRAPRELPQWLKRGGIATLGGRRTMMSMLRRLRPF